MNNQGESSDDTEQGRTPPGADGGTAPQWPSDAEAVRKYGRQYVIFQSQLSLANDIANHKSPPLPLLRQARDDIRKLIESLEATAFCCVDEAQCPGFDSLRLEAAPLLQALSERIDDFEVADQLQKSCKVKLTDIKTPKFSGQVADYLSFRSEFTELIVERASSKVALIKLRDDALGRNSPERLLVEGAQSIEEAFTLLDSQFGDPETQRNSLLVKLRELTPVSNLLDVANLRRLVALVKATRMKLRLIERSESLDSSSFSAIMLKLPSELSREIDKKILKRGCRRQDDDKFNILVEVCEHQLILAENQAYRTLAYTVQSGGAAFGNNYPKPQSQRSGGGKFANYKFPPKGPPPSSNLTQAQAQIQPSPHPGIFEPKPSETGCLFHGKTKHRTAVCNRLFTLPTQHIREVLEHNNYCLKCLSPHGLEKKCGIVCPEPGCPNPKSHCKILHAAFVSAQIQIPPLERNRVSSGTHAVGVGDAPDLPTPHVAALGGEPAPTHTEESDSEAGYDSDGSNTFSLSSDSLQTCLLANASSGDSVTPNPSTALGMNTLRPSQVAYVKGFKGQLCKIRVFFDLGSDLCQATYNCVQKTNLQPFMLLDRLNLRVAGGRKATSFGQSALFSLPIYDKHGVFMFKVDVAAVPFIGQLRQVNIEEQVAKFSEAGYECSDIDPPPMGDIDVLIGCNYPELHPTPISTIDSVTLAQTQAGKILYGAADTFLRANLVTSTLKSAAQSHYVSVACSLIQASGHDTKSHADDIFDKIAMTEDLPCARCGDLPRSSKLEDRKLRIYRDCLEFQPENKRVVARLPWSRDLNDVPDNRAVAEKRLRSVTRALAKTPALQNDYRAEINKMIEKGYLVEVTAADAAAWLRAGNKVWYASHFPVVNDESSSTPVRVIFDCSASYKGVKMSKLWEVPPNLVPDLFSLLIRFRDQRFAMCLDFSKAYWTVHLRDVESHMQRILWNDLREGAPVKTFRMTRNSFGMVPSGAVCTLAMLLVAEHFSNEYPDVLSFLQKSVYVDDGVASFPTLAEAVRHARDIDHVMTRGGFSIKHITFGSHRIDPEEFKAHLGSLPSSAVLASCPTKVLGAIWHPGVDEISVEFRPVDAKRSRKSKKPTASSNDCDRYDNLTLRKYLAAMAGLFDPLGLVSPVSILLKHELGRLFLMGLKWDDPIPDHEEVTAKNHTHTSLSKCIKLLKLAEQVTQLRFSRCVMPLDATDKQPLVVGFCDSSQAAYAACIYFSWQCDSVAKSSLVCSKAKPFPKKGKLITIPRGELLSCWLLSRLVSVVLRQSTHVPRGVYLLSDSTIALRQLHRSPTDLKIWPAVRVEEIQELTLPDAKWLHVSSEQNAADIATRGSSATEIGPGSTWQVGPSFLQSPVDEWPVVSVSNDQLGKMKDSDLEIRPVVQMRLPSSMVVSAGLDPPTSVLDSSAFQVGIVQLFSTLVAPQVRDISSWLRLRRIIARSIHFLVAVAGRRVPYALVPDGFSRWPRDGQRAWLDENDHFVPSVVEMDLACMAVVGHAQSHLSARAISSMAKLNPIIDSFGLWHAVGRAYSNNVAASPFIIPAEAERVAVLILRWCHSKCHSNADTTLAVARQKFWIVRGQVIANRVVGDCAICRKIKKNPVKIEMAPLDPFRFESAPVFSTVYIDLCGPYFCKSERSIGTRANPALASKAWVMVVVCAVSHAVHLELVENYGTSGFLAALDAFVSFRSTPIRIIADSGSQLKAAGAAFESLWAEIDADVIQNHLSEGTEWIFVPSGAHSFIGMAERLVKSIKVGIEATTCSRAPCLEKLHFSRLLYAIANMVNDRPLTVGRNRVSTLDEMRLLRPNDLLFGRSCGVAKQLFDFRDVEPKHERFFDLLQYKKAFLDEFWQKFYSTVFRTLVPRSKWLTTGRQVSVDDIVIIRDTNPVRGIWTWGQVVRVEVSAKDGKARTAEVRYKEALSKKPQEKKRISPSKFVVKSVRDLCVILEADKNPEN